MESLPREFILHHVPLMAVMGLGTGGNSELSSPTSPNSSSSRRSSVSTGSIPTSTRQQLSKSLLTLLTAKSHTGIWEAGKGSGANFHVVAIEKDHQFPPRKPVSLAPSNPNFPASHSPLSPLTSGSPLYPDGLISPIWVRKHREIVPAIVVGFYDLWDRTTISGNISGGAMVKENPDGTIATQEPLSTSENMEKERDGQLAAEIGERRKSIQDRGIKFAAVVILKQQHIDDLAIEERLASIRKASGSDQKNTFFVLPPAAQAELQSFSTNLQKSLYEVALGYYREHGKRIKKKRVKLPSPASVGYVPPPSDLPPNTPHSLSIQGWMIRYDYKMAVFAEFRQEMDTAIRYYESAYNMLVDMFAPSSSITPRAPGFPIRTKRWAEAKVLADCINLKICKLNLYLEASSAAVTQLNRHSATFRRLSNYWKIGEDTFEYWAWLSKQYRIFGDLLEIATKSGFKIPHPTALPVPVSTAGFGVSGPILPLGGSSGINSTMVIQHAGFYYHYAATCTKERRKRFLAIEKLSQESPDDSTLPPPPVLTAESNIEHSALIIELMTKSYEQFKKYKSGRMTLYLASEIAGTYFDSGKHDTALKFFERIAKTYRKENWYTILESILKKSLRCAIDLKAWENVVEYLIELLSDQISVTKEKRIQVQNQLIDILFKNPEANSVAHKPVFIHTNLITSFITARFQFKDTMTFVGAATPFQLTFMTSGHAPEIPLRFDYVRLSFNDAYYNYYLKSNGHSSRQSEKVKLIDCKDCIQEVDNVDFLWTKKVDLNFHKGSTMVFEGNLIPKESGELTLVAASLGLLTQNWKVELNFTFSFSNDQSEEVPQRKWLEFQTQDDDSSPKPKFVTLEGAGDYPSIKVTQKRAKLDIQVKHHSPALLDEHYPIELTIINLESEPVKVLMNIELAALEYEGPEAYITSDPTILGRSSLNEIDIGIIEADQSSVKTIYVFGQKLPTTRKLHLMIWYALASAVPHMPPPTPGWIEKEEVLRIPFIIPFDVSFSIIPQSPGVENKVMISDESLERVEKHLLVARITNSGPWDVLVSEVGLILPDSQEMNTKLKIQGYSTEFDDVFEQQVWKPGSVFQANYLLELVVLDMTSPPTAVDTGSLAITWRRYNKKDGSEPIFNKSSIAARPLEPSKFDISVAIVIPPAPVIGQLFTLTYGILNSTRIITEVHVYVDVHEAFVFAGYKQTLFRVQPLSTSQFRINCFPLAAGKVRLPKIRFVIKGEQSKGTIDQELKVFVPGMKEVSEEDELTIFVKPKQE